MLSKALVSALLGKGEGVGRGGWIDGEKQLDIEMSPMEAKGQEGDSRRIGE